MKPRRHRHRELNEFGQPIGFALPDWKSPPFPPHVTLQGRYAGSSR